MYATLLLSTSLLLAWASGQNNVSDPGVAGPPLEIVHLYYDQWPTGITVSKDGRKFSNYPPGLDANITNDGTNDKYTTAELMGTSTERPYPNAEINNPPGGSINYSTSPATNYQNYLIGMQSVVLDPLDRLWILDTGRALTPDATLVPASPGGPILVSVSLSNDSVIQTIIFPPTVAYADSYLNDIRFDLRAELTESGGGVAYITDSSLEGRNGIIIEVRSERGFVPYIWGVPLYYIPGPGQPLTTTPLGADGITISADGSELYWGPVGGLNLYSVPTERLRDQSPNSELLAQAAVQNRGQRGVSDGFETDTNGYVYAGNMEQNAISFYNPANASPTLFVMDPRSIGWILVRFTFSFLHGSE
ncbi:hypothetical protein K458DRAFT_386044 [Lentithecium fluviatile CBS 122367]|uniref:Major royal jelly protein n=1 Tax=Lentithecium fluviatile CBS 122367 TaxID=1168545 RepID=A0A6G1JAQ2_9PLEO|nr:hypothetical protein K458DRAFT_386044 [Lentithecium fluviatile CBS 122367]